MFIGRDSEPNFLEERYSSNKGELVVLYGRRRIGKTETLKQFCKDKPHLFFSCRECTDKLQLKNFSEKLLKEKVPASAYIYNRTALRRKEKASCNRRVSLYVQRE